MLIVLSGGVCYAWVACCHCLREVGHRPWVGVVWSLCVGGMSSLSKGGTLSSVGGSHLVIVSGCGAVVVGAGSLLVAQGCRLEVVGLLRMGGLLVGAGLWFVGAVVTCRLLCGQH